MSIFRENGGLNIKRFFLSPKRISLRAIASFDVFCAKICVRVSAIDDWKEPVPPQNRQNPLSNPIYIPTRMHILVTIGLGVLELWEGLHYSLPRAHSLKSFLEHSSATTPTLGLLYVTVCCV